MVALWESLCKDSNYGQTMPAWHQNVLGQRLEALNAGV
ncbi:MAG: addiction module protein [Comamonadaceae bacterium]|nr:addiction module protein [Comamonadaceae bacterium]